MLKIFSPLDYVFIRFWILMRMTTSVIAVSYTHLGERARAVWPAPLSSPYMCVTFVVHPLSYTYCPIF